MGSARYKKITSELLLAAGVRGWVASLTERGRKSVAVATAVPKIRGPHPRSRISKLPLFLALAERRAPNELEAASYHFSGVDNGVQVKNQPITES